MEQDWLEEDSDREEAPADVVSNADGQADAAAALDDGACGTARL